MWINDHKYRHQFSQCKCSKFILACDPTRVAHIYCCAFLSSHLINCFLLFLTKTLLANDSSETREFLSIYCMLVENTWATSIISFNYQYNSNSEMRWISILAKTSQQSDTLSNTFSGIAEDNLDALPCSNCI